MLKRAMILMYLLPLWVATACAQTTQLPSIVVGGVVVSVQATAVQTVTVPKKPVPAVTAKRAIVVDYVTGKVLYAKNAMERCHVASLQKMLTGLCIMDRGGLDNKITVQRADTLVEPSKLYISAGEKYSRRDLLKALMVKSGNDVAKALARDNAGSEAKFTNVMNKKARSLGMKHSNFRNASGLTDAAQFSTAYDAAIMARAAFHNPTLRNYMGLKQFTFTYNNGKKKVLSNTNKVLKSVPYCNGLKTGTTRAAGRCLACSGTLNGRTAIVICLGSTSQKIWKDSEALLRWALERPVAQRR